LVNRIQGSNQTEATQAEATKPPEAFAQMTYEQQQYYQYYYAAQYYEYYKQLAQYQQGNGQGQSVQPPETQLDPSVQSYIQQMAYAQYVQHHTSNTNPYAQIVSNVSGKEVPNPYAGMIPEVSAASEEVKPPPVPKSEPEVVVESEAPKNVLLSLAQYGSDSESEEDESPKEDFKVPTGETQIVIDKMATYVAKNGVQFEEIVKAKGDPRFEFLNENHEYYRYYKNKIKSAVEGEEAGQAATAPLKSKEKKVIAPVSFSIKKPKDDGPKEIKSALPVEESDEEEPNPPETATVTLAADATNKEAESPNDTDPAHKNGTIFDGDDPILEMIDLTDDAEERKDAKRGKHVESVVDSYQAGVVAAEDKIKDKLAAAAREKMVSVARDRALQLERKKKAAAFLKLKSAESGGGDEAKSEPADDRKRSRSKERKKEVVQIDDSGDEDDRKKRASKKKKSHKR
jgi:hypothetical protein